LRLRWPSGQQIYRSVEPQFCSSVPGSEPWFYGSGPKRHFAVRLLLTVILQAGALSGYDEGRNTVYLEVW
jgi:hypothetical protein